MEHWRRAVRRTLAAARRSDPCASQPPAGAAADHLAGFTVSIPIARGGRLLMVTSTQVDFVDGALVHQVTFNGNGAAIPAQLEEEMLTAAKARH